MQYLSIGVRCLVGVVFLASFVGKVAGREAFGAFVASVRRMRALPPGLARPVALLVVAGESAVCVLLVVPARGADAAGLVVAAGLLTAFTTGIAISLRLGVRAACRCFGTSTTPLGLRHVARNLGLTITCAVGAGAALTAADAAQPGGATVAIVAGLVLGGLVVVFDDIVDLFGPTKRQAMDLRGRP
ncbi:MauE/DoxX family redox-associated membrane protein [Micromonosporaceae bacterium B7E4]